jgi:kinetochore protein Spc7/SPC105
VVEYLQDSTTSSASTNSTRRASAMSTVSGATQSPTPSSDPSEPPSTPPEQIEEPDAIPSPAPQRQLHQKKRRRRSSAIPPMNFNNPGEEEFSSSPISGSSTAGSDDTGNHTFITANEDNSSASGNESADEGGSTIMSLDEGDTTSHSSITGRSSGGSSTGSTRRLEEALRLAAQQAGTQGIEYDENGDLSMEFANEEVTTAFQPWVKKLSSSTVKGPQHLTSFKGQENQSPFSPPHNSARQPESKVSEDEEMSMDITQAVGGILKARNLGKNTSATKRRKSIAPTGRRSSVNRRRSSGGSSSMGDETMDFTMAIGGIQGESQQVESRDTIDDDEEMTMELTSVIGRVLPSKPESTKRSSAGHQALPEGRRRESGHSLDEEDMDVTTTIGQILPRTNEEAGQEDSVAPMDFTTAIGGILPTHSLSEAKAFMERETDLGEIASSPFQAEVPPSSPPKSPVELQVAAVASATGGPSFSGSKPKSGVRNSFGRRSTTPRISARKRASLSGTPITPSKQLTPQPPKPMTPTKTSTPKSITSRSTSPKNFFGEGLKFAVSTPRSTPLKPIFTQDSKTGEFTPSVTLTPRPRKSSGLGIDKEGLGSPRVTALLDRRRSIGEDAKVFVPSLGEGTVNTVRFKDPRVIELEVDKEQQEEEDRENGRKISHNEVDEEEKDATLNLKEMIKSLTPKKKVNGRKSLAVGTARGLLGKRPVELDDEEDESDISAKKSRIGKEASPVKSVKLRPPPSKVETTGRITRRSLGTAGKSPSTTPTSGSPVKAEAPSTTPKSQRGSKDIKIQSSTPSEPIAPNDESQLEEEVEERIHLQDFLNLTSIRFMELNTTKRRYTVAPKNLPEGSGTKSRAFPDEASSAEDDASRNLESCVVAGACTIPMLELYQHVSSHRITIYSFTNPISLATSSKGTFLKGVELYVRSSQTPTKRTLLSSKSTYLPHQTSSTLWTTNSKTSRPMPGCLARPRGMNGGWAYFAGSKKAWTKRGRI